MPRDRVVYVGDGSSDLHVMLHRKSPEEDAGPVELTVIA